MEGIISGIGKNDLSILSRNYAISTLTWGSLSNILKIQSTHKQKKPVNFQWKSF